MGSGLGELECFGEFFGEGAVGAAGAGLLAGRLITATPRGPIAGSVRSAMWRSTVSRRGTGAADRPRLALRLRRLSRVRAQQPVFERSPIEPADDGVHLFVVRRVDEGESLGLLRFGIADHFNGVRDQVFG